MQLSVDFTNSRAFARSHLRPVAGVDLQFREESDWELDRTVVADMQPESTRLGRIETSGLLEYYGGRSPNGQFCVRAVEYVGSSLLVEFRGDRHLARGWCEPNVARSSRSSRQRRG